MNNQNVNQDVNKNKRGRGRPRILTDAERKDHTRQSKSKYMLNKEWYCTICRNNKNYTLSGKFCHLKTKKHAKNAYEINMMEQIDRITQRLNP